MKRKPKNLAHAAISASDAATAATEPREKDESKQPSQTEKSSSSRKSNAVVDTNLDTSILPAKVAAGRRQRRNMVRMRSEEQVQEQIDEVEKELEALIVAGDWDGPRVYGFGWGDHGRLGLGEIGGISVLEPDSMDRLCQEGVNPRRVAAGDRHSIILGENGKVYACGDNGDGQLGTFNLLGNAKLSRAEKASRRMSTTHTEMESAAAAATAAAAASGSASENERKKKKKKAQKEAAATRDPYMEYRKKWKSVPGEVYPKEVRPNEDWGFITSVVCGSASSFAINGRGHVYSFGLNSRGQLGVGDTDTHFIPTRIRGPIAERRVKMVAAGHMHALAMTGPGKLYSWGNNGQGQLGLGDKKNRHSPCAVDSIRRARVMQIAAGHGHSLCVATTKESEHVGFKNSRKKDKDNFRVVFAWGDNSRGQLGFGFNADADPIKFMNKSKTFGENCTLSPTVAVGVSEIFADVEGLVPERVAAGKYFSAVVTAMTTVMTFGNNDYGQLGQGDLFDREKPKVIDGLSNVEQLVCGDRHALVLNSSGHVYGWGYNYCGELGLGHSNIVLSPALLKDFATLKVSGIAAGEKHTLAIGAEGADNDTLAFDPERKHEKINLTNELRTATRSAEVDGFSHISLSKPIVKRGKYSWNVRLDRMMSDDVTAIGVCYSDEGEMEVIGDPGNHGDGAWAYLSSGMKMHDGWEEEYGSQFWWTDTIGIEVDMELGTLKFSRNGKDQGVAYYTQFEKPLCLYVGMAGETDAITLLEPEEEEEGDIFTQDEDMVCVLYDETKKVEKASPLEVFFKCSTCRLGWVCRACAYQCHFNCHLELVINRGGETCQCGVKDSCKSLPQLEGDEGEGGGGGGLGIKLKRRKSRKIRKK